MAKKVAILVTTSGHRSHLLIYKVKAGVNTCLVAGRTSRQDSRPQHRAQTRRRSDVPSRLGYLAVPSPSRTEPNQLSGD